MTAANSIPHAPDALSNRTDLDVISGSEAHTLDELFRERVRRSPEQTAYSQFDALNQCWSSVSWADVAVQVERWQVAFRRQGLVKGDRVAVCFRNSVEWIVFDQAALRLGLVVVPLYTADRPDNIAYVLANSRARLVLLEDAELWPKLCDAGEDLTGLTTVLVFSPPRQQPGNEKVVLVEEWLPEIGQHLERGCAAPDDLASIVYTSGTTGRPKGVMLSHKNMLSNAYAGLRSVAIKSGTRVLSFLPLSHTLERTVGYYASVMAGAQVSFNRSIPELAEDLKTIRPQLLISVPRIFDRIHNQIYQQLATASAFRQWMFAQATDIGWRHFQYQQGQMKWHPKLLLHGLFDHLVGSQVRAQLGGELQMVIVGGAPLSLPVAKTFISLGVPLLQGYGLTESSPVISVNTLSHNRPDSIGLPLRGVRVKIAEQDELLVQGDNVMLGYWGMPDATDKVLQDGWLRTGDRASIDSEGFLRITGRLKDILVLANGEKVPPADIEAAILRDVLFEQVLVLGEGRSFLSALVVLNQQQATQLAKTTGEELTDLQSDYLQNELLSRIAAQMEDFPGYAKIRRVAVCDEEWTVENGLLTPTLKVKRAKVIEAFKPQVDALYAGHGVHGAN